MNRKRRPDRDADKPLEPLPKPPMPADSSSPQSGDLQGLSDVPDAESESVRQLVEEGQYFEAAITSGVEDAPGPEAGPVKTHHRKMDDVPPEYTEHPPDEPKE